MAGTKESYSISVPYGQFCITIEKISQLRHIQLAPYVKNLTGHGVGRNLHEAPDEIANFRDTHNKERFKKNSVVAIETFISTSSAYAQTLYDGWTMVGNKGGFMAQHEHTIVVTDKTPIILTEKNGIWS